MWAAASLLAAVHVYPNGIVFPYSNGGLDPWSAGGVTQNISNSLVAVVIPDGAHHLDLRSRSPLDPKSVQQARAMEVCLMKEWIEKARHSHWCGTATTLAFTPLLALLGLGQDSWYGHWSISLLLPHLHLVATACVHERGRQQVDGEHSHMINSSQSAWIELPALVCFPLLPFSNAVLYYTVRGSCSRLAALLLTALSDCSNCWCIQQWITWECCWWWNSCGLQCDWTEITSYCHFGGEVGELKVCKGTKQPLPFGISVGKEVNVQLFSYLVFQQLFNWWIFVFCAEWSGLGPDSLCW